MKLLFLLAGCLVTVWGIRWWTRRPVDHLVSEDWLAEHAQYTGRNEFEGVSWQFPVNKLRNERPLAEARRRRA